MSLPPNGSSALKGESYKKAKKASRSRVRNYRIREALDRAQRELRNDIITAFPNNAVFLPSETPHPSTGISFKGSQTFVDKELGTDIDTFTTNLDFDDSTYHDDPVASIIDSPADSAIDATEERGDLRGPSIRFDTDRKNSNFSFCISKDMLGLITLLPPESFDHGTPSGEEVDVQDAAPSPVFGGRHVANVAPIDTWPKFTHEDDFPTPLVLDTEPEGENRSPRTFDAEDDRLRLIQHQAALRYIEHINSPPICESCTRLSLPQRSSVGHCSLLETLEPHEGQSPLPDVLGYENLLADRTPKSTKVPHCSISKTLTGRDGKRLEPPILDLNLDICRNPVAPVVTYDCDSFIAFLTSLAALKNGLAYYPCSNPANIINADLHFKTRYETLDGQGNASHQNLEFRKIPHLILGLIGNSRNVTVYLAFPGMYRPDRRTAILTDDQLEYFHDEIMLKAMAEVLDSSTMQHHGLSYSASSLRTKAKQVEMRSKFTTSYASAQYAGNLIPPEKLGRLWECIQKFTSESGRAEFVGAQLFVDAKNLKLERRLYGSDQGLQALLEATFEKIKDEFNMEFVSPEDFYLDIGEEITPPNWSPLGQRYDGPRDDGHQTYFFKECCLKSWCKNLFEEGAERQAQFYSNFLLPQAVNMRYTTRRKDMFGRAKVPYFQAYACFKESLDYMKTMPFQGDLEALAVDPTILEVASRAGGGGIVSHDVPARAYGHSKKRTFESLQAASSRSYGRRFEVRGEYRFWEEVLSCLKASRGSVSPPADGEIVPPSHCWVLPTRTVTDFVIGTANKFASVFELTDMDAKRKNYANYRSTQLMTVALRLLKVFMGANDINMDLAVAASLETRRSRKIRGLGLKKSFQRYNFPWIEAIVKDSEYAIRASCSQELLFGNRILRSRYRARYHRVSSVEEDSLSVLLCADWLKRYPSEFNKDEIVLFMCHIILRRFRRDVYHANYPDLKKSRSGDGTAEPGEDDLLLTYYGVRRLFGTPPHLSEGGRLQKRAFGEYYEYLFGLGPDARGRWDGHPYRELIRKVSEVATQNSDIYPRLFREFEVTLKAECVKYHWILPKANQREFHQLEGKKGYRPWGCPPLCYGGARYTSGTTPPFPDVLTRKRNRWLRSLREHTETFVNKPSVETSLYSEDEEDSLVSEDSSDLASHSSKD